MHELPKDLSNSLRSWRGSMSVRNRPSVGELEKGPEDYGEEGEEQLSSSDQRSLISHPSASARNLRHTQRYGRPPEDGKEQDGDHEQHNSSNQRGPKVKTNPPAAAVTKKKTVETTPASNMQSIFSHAPKIRDPDPAAARLDDNMKPLTEEHFYELIGMYPPRPDGQRPKEVARPHGLYAQIRSKHSYIQTKYRVFDIFNYIFLAVQLLLSAVFIVLGGLRADYHIAVAILGAVSAVIAGALSLMKGQGLPNRLRQVRDDLHNVLFAADELYWDAAAGKNILYKDIKKVREDYLSVLAEARKNHPDSWTSAANTIAHGTRSPSKVKIPKM
ncbi:Hypothetical predicted protein [Lecanosticta acicola]|uniref:SMODS and SLOG-associating 2TM effector domain-containing protein n=1 Tax=Lecanosticta acicola TaxID=111012 RepID=A0AAI8Z8G5_9PEZI|nr:Hypothetical predicted protein [Lecanosticta acicola]